MYPTALRIEKQQECSDIELIVQKLAELEAKQQEALEQRYTDNDLTFSWHCGYESRRNEELLLDDNAENYNEISDGFWTR
jgi:hypothetical protein